MTFKNNAPKSRGFSKIYDRVAKVRLVIRPSTTSAIATAWLLQITWIGLNHAIHLTVLPTPCWCGGPRLRRALGADQDYAVGLQV